METIYWTSECKFNNSIEIENNKLFAKKIYFARWLPPTTAWIFNFITRITSTVINFNVRFFFYILLYVFGSWFFLKLLLEQFTCSCKFESLRVKIFYFTRIYVKLVTLVLVSMEEFYKNWICFAVSLLGTSSSRVWPKRMIFIVKVPLNHCDEANNYYLPIQLSRMGMIKMQKLGFVCDTFDSIKTNMTRMRNKLNVGLYEGNKDVFRYFITSSHELINCHLSRVGRRRLSKYEVI